MFMCVSAYVTYVKVYIYIFYMCISFYIYSKPCRHTDHSDLELERGHPVVLSVRYSKPLKPPLLHFHWSISAL